MKRIPQIVLLVLISFSAIGCFEDNDDTPITTEQINDFVWRGMNRFYLYKDDVPDLANDRFSNSSNEYTDYLNSFSSPEELFENLIYKRKAVDRFSWIVDDYIALEEFFKGISVSNGMEFQLFRFASSGSDRYGVVTHVLPNTSAEANGVKRGDIFYGIDGTQLTSSNVSQLVNQNNYTINIGTYNDNGTPDTDDDFVEPTTQSISLTKAQYTKNPILVNDVLSVSGKKIAYLMYNGFTGTDQFNSELNSAFGTFKNAGANELVLDLRYNPGGSVKTAILLAGLITGQFTGEIFSTEEWNDEFQEALENEDPELLINRFVNNNDGAPLNSLNLSKAYILTTGRSASASELVINSLRPYIEVIQIGTTTAGKYQASTTLYDSPDFRRDGVNPSHTYAMQPLIFKSLNVNGETDYFEGLSPNIVVGEKVNNLGILGDVNEPLLAAAISHIDGTSKSFLHKPDYLEITNGSEDFDDFEIGMYQDKELPLNVLNINSFE
ncbi:S41 family peptidase [Tamlana sp. 2201CG12-4]|uniref:S41 family peptidase n=1 Tax=Tamlana sp. 2201CG12-4 TaxID=3112582 RepID=UPI002DBA2FFD|nr:S41 family peptidase [Tamlana sp. 2201CG12-4]MEC3908385.1 S41 family peptidase [Tamlana sp. 2201CG12-4]